MLYTDAQLDDMLKVAIDLAVEQNKRLVEFSATKRPSEVYRFFGEPHEVFISNRIAQTLGHYAFHKNIIFEELEEIPL